MRKWIVLAVAVFAVPLFAANEAFLEIDGIKPLTVSSFSWGLNTAAAQGCATKEMHFTAPPAAVPFFANALQKNEQIPRAKFEFLNTHHEVENVTVRAVQGNTITLHFVKCLSHPTAVVAATGVVKNTTIAPKPVVLASTVNPGTLSVAPTNAQMIFDSGPAQHFNLVSLRVTGNTATLKLRNDSSSFFQAAASSRTKNTKVTLQKDAMSFSFANCVVSSYSRGADGTDTVGLSFSLYGGPPGGYLP